MEENRKRKENFVRILYETANGQADFTEATGSSTPRVEEQSLHGLILQQVAMSLTAQGWSEPPQSFASQEETP